MAPCVRRLLAIAALGAIVFAVVTLVALDGNEVVVLHTGGAAHATRTWIAEEEQGTLLVEAANPERPFLRDLQAAPRLELERHGTRRPCTATILPNPEGHDRIRRLLAMRYGWADAWIALLTDTHASLAVRLACAKESR